MKLSGRRVIITGGSQGFGFAVAEDFLKAGAEVLICGRHLASLELAYEKLSLYKLRLHYIQADTSLETDMERLFEMALTKMGSIEVVVANAAIQGPTGPLEQLSWEEWSTTIDINLKGTVLICKTVLTYLKKQGYGKIIVLSGGGATAARPYFSAYAASKAAVVRFAETLAHEVADYSIDVNAVAPGALNTRLLDEILAAGPEKIGPSSYQQALEQKSEGGIPLTTGAELCRYLASAESDGLTGRLISAVWDPWRSLHKHKEQLRNSDVYTLRRITPKDRSEWCSE